MAILRRLRRQRARLERDPYLGAVERGQDRSARSRIQPIQGLHGAGDTLRGGQTTGLVQDAGAVAQQDRRTEQLCRQQADEQRDDQAPGEGGGQQASHDSASTSAAST